MFSPLFKLLRTDRMPCNGGTGRWPVPGVWREVEGPIVPCKNGLHVCRARHLLAWARVGVAVWRVEVDGDVLDDYDKVVASRARLIEPVGVLTARVLRLAAADIAESVAHLHDHHPVCMEAIRIARLHAHGLASGAMMQAVGYAVQDVSRGAAYAAYAPAYAPAALAAAAITVPGTSWSAIMEAQWYAAGAVRAAAREATRDAGAILLDNLARYGGGA